MSLLKPLYHQFYLAAHDAMISVRGSTLAINIEIAIRWTACPHLIVNAIHACVLVIVFWLCGGILLFLPPSYTFAMECHIKVILLVSIFRRLSRCSVSLSATID